ncbi:MAG: hypothetical protein R3E56_18005 [Burkholderiaceae bacterium]
MRALRDADLPWLCDLYASTRSDEMALVPWPDPVKRQFIEQQFMLQHRHYLAHYPEASFWAIEHRHSGARSNNYYLLRTPPEHLIIHISLLPNARNGGLGSALIQQCQADAAADGCGVRLHVRADQHRCPPALRTPGLHRRSRRGLTPADALGALTGRTTESARATGPAPRARHRSVEHRLVKKASFLDSNGHQKDAHLPPVHGAWQEYIFCGNTTAAELRKSRENGCRAWFGPMVPAWRASTSTNSRGTSSNCETKVSFTQPAKSSSFSNSMTRFC